MVMHYFNNNARSLAYVTANYMVERYLAVFVLSYAISFVLSMLIETPVRNLIKPAKKSPAPNVEGKKNQPNSNTFEPVLSTITTESGDCQNLKLSKPAVFSIQNDYTSFLGTGAKSGNDEDSALSSSVRSSEPSQRGALTDTESGHHYYSDLSRSTSSSEMSEGYPALEESRVTFSDDPSREANGSLQKVSNTPQTGSDPEQSRPTLNGEPEHGEIKTGEDNHGFQVDDAVTLKAPQEEGAREAKNSNIGGDNAVAIRM
ncbi:uncharacterized protein LOC101847292 [Aplysia californica]|nr:uncharacterized protein LOC101847292 [Aplysia californica]